MVNGQRLYDLDIENRTRVQKKSNVYKGKITRVEPSLEAAFVDFGAERHGFLPLKEISREYFYKKSESGRPRIKDVVKEGTEVIVQVDKEERGNKGAALTTFISLAGRYLVLMPNNPRAGGISRRIEGDERSQLREALNSIDMPKGMGVIVRTAGVGREAEDLQWDFNYLLNLWKSVTTAAQKNPAPTLLLQESNVIIRAVRDYLREDIGEVMLDSPEAHKEALDFVSQVMPQYQSRIKQYIDPVPLFNRYQIESQIETAFEREVSLPSGGSIVIDPTEALVSIDINSAKATRGSDIEETALQTNLEAADEIARQLRLRDIGGLIVIDFIDMSSQRNQREVENRVKDALAMDRARIQVGRISRFGLLEMSRQRLRPSLGETSAKVCPRCNGQGTIRDTKSLALSILRLLAEEANKERSAEIRAIVPLKVATYLLNEKRGLIHDIEVNNNTRVLVIGNPDMRTPHYDVQRLRDDNSLASVQELSYSISLEAEEVQDYKPSTVVPTQQVAAVQTVTPVAQAANEEAPKAAPAKAKEKAAPAAPGLFARLGSAISSLFSAEEEKKEEPKKPQTNNRRSNNNGQNRNNDRNRNRNRSNDRNRNSDNRSDGRNDKRSEGRSRNDGRSDSRSEDRSRNDGRSDNRNRNDSRRDADKRERPANQQRNRDDAPQRNRNRNDKNDNRQQQPKTENTDTRQNESEDSNNEGSRPQRRPSNKRNRSPQQRRRGQRMSEENRKQEENVSTDKQQPAVVAPAPTAAPKAEAAVEAPKAQAAVEAPKAEAAVEAPKAEAAVEAPKAEAAVEAPKAEVAVEAPKAEVAVEAPKAEVAVEAPKAEVAVEAPKAEVAVEAPKAEAAVEAPKAEAAVEAPKAEAAVEAPKAEVAVEAPKTKAAPARASNDPRAKSKPVTKLEVTNVAYTGQDDLAPLEAIEAPSKSKARASNDPRNNRA
ncbi:Ribonuclease E [Sinobacterium norvegicum]|uniref:Ribonuclease E n=2 Tax=Sinobacterium norvegicum TaxID=1641715 RepID=A0ABM9AAF5_9GAMM|nr:Ribonuclease E [Sinobacterium norvegicum]